MAQNYPPAGRLIHVVLVKEDDGWEVLFCTDPNATVRDILEPFADRAAIEPDFHDLKEVWGNGQQQVIDSLAISLQSFDSMVSADSVASPPVAPRRMDLIAITDIATFMFNSLLAGMALR